MYIPLLLSLLLTTSSAQYFDAAQANIVYGSPNSGSSSSNNNLSSYRVNEGTSQQEGNLVRITSPGTSGNALGSGSITGAISSTSTGNNNGFISGSSGRTSSSNGFISGSSNKTLMRSTGIFRRVSFLDEYAG